MSGCPTYRPRPVTEREPLEERRMTRDRSRHAGRLHAVPAGVVPVRALTEVLVSP